MLGSVTRPLYAWDAGVPGYGYVRGLQAFALEETGNYSAAEVAGRDAISRNAGDVWAAHAVAHVMEMQDRPQEGVAWVAGLEHAWGACNNFAYHIHWHRCLFLLDPGDAARSEEHTSELQSLMRISYAVFCVQKKN